MTKSTPPPLSQRVAAVQPSMTLAMAARARALAAAGKDVISFAVGEPDFPTPVHIREAAHQALEAGFTRYTPVDGLVSTKDAIRTRLKEDQGLVYASDQLMVTVGGKGALSTALLALVNPGDKVVMPAPYWVSYPDMVRLAGGEPVVVPTTPEQGFRLTPEALRPHLAGARVFMFNSPSNPSGVTYTPDEVAALMEEVRRSDAFIISDEMYDRLVFDGIRCVSPATLSRELFERTLVVNAVSKTYAMTGWRLGWAAGPAPLIKAMTRLQGAMVSSAPSLSQKAAEAALSGPRADLDAMVAEFDVRRHLLVDGLNQIPGLTCPTPGGAFYALCSAAGWVGKSFQGRTLATDLELAEALLDSQNLVCVAGTSFGVPGCLRFSYAVSRDHVAQGLTRLRAFGAALT